MAMALLLGLADSPASTPSFANEDVSSPSKLKLMVEGTFPLYQSGDSILMEFPRQLDGREIEILGQVDEGFGLLNRPVQSLGVVWLSIPDSMTIEFRQPFYAERVLNSKSNLLKPFLQSNGPVLGDVYHAVSVSKEGNPIIDITDVVRGEKEWVSNPQNAQIRSLLPEMSRFLATHQLASNDGIQKNEQGVSFSVLRYYEAEAEQYAYNSMAILLPSGSKSLRMSIAVRLLPQKSMPIHLASRGIAAQTIRFKDYSQNPYTVVDDSLVVRWNPQRSCVCYVDDRVPSRYVDAFERGVLSWNLLLQKAKVKFRLQVKKVEKSMNLASLPCLLSYDVADKGVSSQKVVHPRTGEILSFRLNVGHDFKNPISPDELQRLIHVEIAELLGLQKGIAEENAIRSLSYMYR